MKVIDTTPRETLRTREAQIARVRRRLDNAVERANEPGSYTRIIGIVRGIMDIIEDDGRENSE